MKDFIIGVISDTHGLLREEAVLALKGADLIIHAGDIGNMKIIKELEKEAPVVYVRGNCDKEEWAQQVHLNEVVEIGDKLIYVLHDVDTLDLDPAASGFHVVVYGHSHKPSISYKEEVLFLNPGSAGPRRFKLPTSIALIDINNAVMKPRIIEIL
ncbi:MAG: metallophosphoesterase family protein [Bacillota bacterium]|nr:metallophosphoesterase family protein [Bacillota bacterium]